MPRKPRVDIPNDPSAVIALLKKIREKHTADGAKSPLAGMDWTLISKTLDDADLHDQAADKAKRTVEKEYRERDTNVPVVEQAVRSARDILLALNADNTKTLGDWSFDVTDSPAPAAKPVTPTVKPS